MALDLSRELVLKKLAISFPDPTFAQQALQSLDSYGVNERQPMRDLIHLAILKLSDGKLWRLRELVQKAKRDFRDVLYPAQAPESCRMGRADPRGQKKKLSQAEEAAIEKRDQDQWLAWISAGDQ